MKTPKPGEYAHQCRYCAYCVFTADEDWWCDSCNFTVQHPKRANGCSAFLWNPIPADNIDKRYTPRKKRAGTQLKLFDGVK